MTSIYVTENNCRCYGVTFRNNGMIRVQKLEDVSNNKNIIYEVNPRELFLGKSQLCDITDLSGAKDKEKFNGSTNLIKIGEENNRHRYLYIGGDMVCSFLTNDRIYKYISKMGKNLTPYSIAIGRENIYHLTPYFKFIKKRSTDENDNGKLLDYHNISNCQKIKTYKIHINGNNKGFINFLYFSSLLCLYKYRNYL